jgi:pimeloyl-ACP methyl ester carboxylesterase
MNRRAIRSVVAFVALIVLLFSINNLLAWQKPATYVIEAGVGANPPTVALWLAHMKNADVTGDTYIGPIAGNGTIDSRHMNDHRDTIIFVPSQYDKSRPTEMLIWLHGHNGFNKFEKRILRHIDELYQRGGNPVIVAVEQPWSHWTSTRTSRNGTGPFRRSGEFEEWMDVVFEVLERYGVPTKQLSSKNVTLYGHSAGGSGIMCMAKSGALDILRPGRIVFSDSTYGRWFDVVYDKYLVRYPETEVFVLTQQYGKPWKAMTRFLKSRDRARISKNIHHVALSRKNWTHKRIGDNCLLHPGNPF